VHDTRSLAHSHTHRVLYCMHSYEPRYCTPADFDNFLRLVGPSTATPAGLLATGHYATDLERWARVVPRSRTLVVFYEDFAANALGVMDIIQEFLGVPRLSYENLTEHRPGSNLTFLKGVPSKKKSKRHVSPTLVCLLACKHHVAQSMVG
jgi:hypothetical protein